MRSLAVDIVGAAAESESWVGIIRDFFVFKIIIFMFLLLKAPTNKKENKQHVRCEHLGRLLSVSVVNKSKLTFAFRLLTANVTTVALKVEVPYNVYI